MKKTGSLLLINCGLQSYTTAEEERLGCVAIKLKGPQRSFICNTFLCSLAKINALKHSSYTEITTYGMADALPICKASGKTSFIKFGNILREVCKDYRQRWIGSCQIIYPEVSDREWAWHQGRCAEPERTFISIGYAEATDIGTCYGGSLLLGPCSQ